MMEAPGERETAGPRRRRRGGRRVRGGRWTSSAILSDVTLLLIRDLLGGKKRYGEFLVSAEKIPTNILADRLKAARAGGDHPPGAV